MKTEDIELMIEWLENRELTKHNKLIIERFKEDFRWFLNKHRSEKEYEKILKSYRKNNENKTNKTTKKDLALKEYQKIRDSAWEEYEKIKDPAWKEYQQIDDSAYEEYVKITDPSWKKYVKITDPAYKEYLKKCEEIDLEAGNKLIEEKEE